MSKEHLTKKISLLTIKLNINFGKKLVRFYNWSIALYGSKTWTLRKLELKHLKCDAGREWKR